LRRTRDVEDDDDEDEHEDEHDTGMSP